MVAMKPTSSMSEQQHVCIHKSESQNKSANFLVTDISKNHLATEILPKTNSLLAHYIKEVHPLIDLYDTHHLLSNELSSGEYIQRKKNTRNGFSPVIHELLLGTTEGHMSNLEATFSVHMDININFSQVISSD